MDAKRRRIWLLFQYPTPLEVQQLQRIIGGLVE